MYTKKDETQKKHGLSVSFNLLQAAGVGYAIIDTKEDKSSLILGSFVYTETDKTLVKKEFEVSKQHFISSKEGVLISFNAAECYLLSEEKVKEQYKGYRSLYGNTKLSFKSPSLERQYFLVENNVPDEEVENNIKEQFFQKALIKLPIPIKKEWQQYIWDDIKNYFEEMTIVGNSPYKCCFAMKLPDATVLQSLVELCHKSHLFKTKHKNVPRLKSIIYGVCDIDNFVFKEWQEMLKLIGGQEVLVAQSADKQKSLAAAFEIFGAKQFVWDYINRWHTIDLRKIGLLIKSKNEKIEKDAIRTYAARLFEICEGNQEFLYIGLNNFETILDKGEEALKTRNKTKILEILNNMAYADVQIGCEELAMVCSQAKVSEKNYKTYEEEYLEHLDNCLIAPKSYPTIYRSLDNDVKWEIIDMSIPRAWVVGLETHCCQHLHSCGGACVRYAAKNPSTAGIVRISKKGVTVAQSFMWLSDFDAQGKRIMVLDNIEINGHSANDVGELEKTNKKYIIDAYKHMAETLESYAALFRIKNINIGTGYSDVSLNSFCDNPKEGEMAKIPSTLNYTDANRQFVLKRFTFTIPVVTTMSSSAKTDKKGKK